MLTRLTIKQYALIEELSVDFESGLNIITGWQRPEYSQMGLWPGDEYFARREITAKLIRRCRVEVIEGARSLAMYTHPQQYADAILRFLANPGV